MRAFVSDQSSNFNAKVIDGPPGHTVVASLDLPPGSWVVFATVALAGNAAPGTTVIRRSLSSAARYTVGRSSVIFQVIPFNTGLVLDTAKTLQVACVAQPANAAVSQPTTITAIEVGSVTRIT